MLELRPNCELCDCELPPHSTVAMICTYECTYCKSCVETKLLNVCPTCGGGFCPRPMRPQKSWRAGKTLSLTHQPASTTRVHSPYSWEDIQEHRDRIKDLPPEKR